MHCLVAAQNSHELTNMIISPANTHVPFARVENVNLAEVANASEGAFTEQLQRLISKHGALIFPKQELTPQQQSKINRAFGYHNSEQTDFANFGWTEEMNEKYQGVTSQMPDAPDVQLQGNVAYVCPSTGVKVAAGTWTGLTDEGFHSDGLHNMHKDLPVITNMYCLKAPAAGGQTFLIDTRGAFEVQSEERKRYLRTLRVHYWNNDFLNWRGPPVMDPTGVTDSSVSNDIKPTELSNATIGGPIHPLVRKHVDTGDEAVFVSCGNIAYISQEGSDGAIHLDHAASKALAAELLGDYVQEPLLYTHTWSVGDFVVFDQRITHHSGSDYSSVEGERLMRRVRLQASPSCNADCEGVWSSPTNSNSY